MWAVVGSLWLFPLLTVDSDEGAYLAQAASLRAGDLLPVAPSEHPEAYQPWFAVLRDGHYVYKYTPVQASLLAASDAVLGTPRAALAIVAFATVALVALFARELGASRRTAALACLVFALSPLWLVISASFLPYASNLALLLLFAVALLRAQRLGSRGLLVVAGLAGGTAFFSRPFDTTVFVAIVGGWVLWSARGTRTWRRLTGWCALGAVAPLALFAFYNTVATGSPTRLAFHLAGSADQLGFGDRSIRSGDTPFQYSPWDGVVALMNNVKLTVTWAFGSALLLVAAAIGFVQLQHRRAGSLLPMLLLAWPVAFFFFWGSYATVLVWRIADDIGPYYYLPMLVPLAVGGAVGILVVARRRRRWVATIVAGFAAVSLVTLVPAVRDSLERTDNRQAVDAALDAAIGSERALVFLPPLAGEVLQHPFAFLRNEPRLEGRVVYAINRGNANFDVLDDHPTRTPYVVSVPGGYYDLEPGRDVGVTVERVHPTTGRSLDVTLHLDAARALDDVHVRVEVANAQVAVPLGADGTARFSLRTTTDGVRVETSGASATAVVEPGTQILVSVTKASGAHGSTTVQAMPLRSDHGELRLFAPGATLIDTFPGRDDVRTTVEAH